MIDWKRLLKAIAIVAIAALIFCILFIVIEWLANNHPTFLTVSVITFFILFIIGIIYVLLGEFDD